MKITTVGMDLAKHVFQVHGVDAQGQAILCKKLDRSKVLEFFVRLPPCLIGMEACGSAHYWARKLQAMGHVVKLMAPQFVKPYVKTNKNDAADAVEESKFVCKFWRPLPLRIRFADKFTRTHKKVNLSTQSTGK